MNDLEFAAQLQTALLAWYDERRRDLPWRRTRDPYAIWVSEVMLQQTRVETATPYYERFLEAFPTVRDLARAEEEQVLALWSGLGYYSRARNLRAGAQAIDDRHDGRFPHQFDDALALPGVGPYTAAAVVSIAYGAPHAVVDGNVARVLARLDRLDPPVDRGVRLQVLAQSLLSLARPGDFNQSMMELGATVCTPLSPVCPTCPVSPWCRAYADGVVDRYPLQKRRPDPVDVPGTIVLVRDSQGRLLLERGRWRWLHSLWLPPILDRSTRGEGFEDLWATNRGGSLLSKHEVVSIAWLGQVSHTITHHRLRLDLLRVEVASKWTPPTDEQTRWVEADGLAAVGRSGLLTKALRLESAGQQPLLFGARP